MPEVILKYHGEGKGFGPEKKQVLAKLNDSLVFRLHPGTREEIDGAKLRISFHKPEFFSAPKVEHTIDHKGDESLAVTVTALPATGDSVSFYKCELLDRNLNVLAEVDGAAGGEIVPDHGGS